MFYDYPVLERQSRTLMEETAEFREERGELEKAQKEETRRTAVRKLLSRLKEDPEAYGQFLDLPPRLREELLDFYTGQRGVKITYELAGWQKALIAGDVVMAVIIIAGAVLVVRKRKKA